MALVDDDQIKEILTEFAVGVLIFIVVRKALIQRKIDFIGFVDFLMLDDRHFVFEVTKITAPGLVDQGVAVGQEQDAFFGTGLP